MATREKLISEAMLIGMNRREAEATVDRFVALNIFSVDPEPAEKTDGQKIAEEWLAVNAAGDLCVRSGSHSQLMFPGSDLRQAREVLSEVIDAALRDDRKARAEKLSPRRRKQIAIKASLAAAAKRRKVKG